MQIKNVCVFCSSSNNLEKEFYNEAKRVGKFLASRNLRLIYGGTDIGLMGAVAREVKNHGGEAWGVIPELIHNKGLSFDLCDRLIITSDLRERKRVMFEESDVFIALPGGFGTLEEIFEVITLKQLQFKNPPVVFLNTLSYFDPLEKFMSDLFDKGFTSHKYRNLYYIASNVNELDRYLEKYVPDMITDKWSI
jgi:cytokinin riboside 5'-monophosphate phosphoribohydrolase